MQFVMSSISLRIGGNKLANSGFSVLVNIGSPSPDIKDMTAMPGLIENEYYFFLRHEADQIVYTVQKTRIRSYGAARDGRLLMAIGIPRGYEVEAASPYDVLMDVYNTFISRYTTDSLGGTQFSNVEVDVADFQNILDRYQLVPARNRYLTMNTDRASKAFVLVPSAKQIAELMRDSQYVEFQPFGEIIIAQEGSTTYPRLSISIPRPLHYKVYVNNFLSKKEITSLTEPYTATADVGENFECTPLQFTLADLKAGNIPPEVKLDLQKETVYCTLTPHPKVQTWRLALEGDHPGYDQVRIRDKRSGAEIPVDAAGQFQLSGNQISSVLEVFSADTSFIKNGLDTKDTVNKVLSAKFMKRKPVSMTPRSAGGSDSMTQNVSFKIKPSSFKDRRIDLHLDGGGKELVIPQVLVDSDRTATVPIPVGFFPRFIRVSAESEHYSTFDQNVGLEPEKGQDVVLTFSKKDFLSFSWGKMLLSGLAGILLGVLIGWLCFGGVLKPQPKSASGGKQTQTQTQTSSTPSLDDIKSSVEKLKTATMKMTLSEVETIIENSNNANLPKEDMAPIQPYLDAYEKVLDKIKKREVFDNDILDKSGNTGKYLSQEVRASLQATCLGFFDISKDNNNWAAYEKVEKERAISLYKEKKEFNSFEDLYAIAKEVKEQK